MERAGGRAGVKALSSFLPLVFARQLPPFTCVPLGQVLIGDAVEYLRTTTERFDVVICDFPDALPPSREVLQLYSQVPTSLAATGPEGVLRCTVRLVPMAVVLLVGCEGAHAFRRGQRAGSPHASAGLSAASSLFRTLLCARGGSVLLIEALVGPCSQDLSVSPKRTSPRSSSTR